MTDRRQYGVTTGDLEPTDRRAFMLDSPGSARDNDDWIRRQGRVVERFGHSSLFVGQLCRDLAAGGGEDQDAAIDRHKREETAIFFEIASMRPFVDHADEEKHACGR